MVTLELREWTDQPTWDAFVGSQLTGHFNQSWGWGDIAEPFGGTPFRYAVVDGTEIKATMSVVRNPINRSPFTNLYVSRGPVVDTPTEEIIGLLDEGMQKLAHDGNGLLTKLEPFVPASNTEWPALLRGLGYSPLFPPSQPRSIWVIDISADLETIQAEMKPKWRYNIRLAAKRGVEVIRCGEEGLDEYYDLYVETARRDDFYIHPKNIYLKILRTFSRLNQFDLLIARFEGEPIAGMMLNHLGRATWYTYGASTNRHRDVMAPHALQWEAIKIAKERGAVMYDMRGVPDVPARDQDMNGVYRFKQGFGGYHLTLMEQYAKGHKRLAYPAWRSYWQGRYAVRSIRRRRAGLPHRQWA